MEYIFTKHDKMRHISTNFFYLISLSKKNGYKSYCLLRNCNCTARSNIWLRLVLHAIFGATLWRHVNNCLNVCTALITEFKILVFGLIFVVWPFSIILDRSSFQNKFNKSCFVFIRFFKQNGERSPLKQIWVLTPPTFIFIFHIYF
jgi:hypothetical protein